MTDTDRDQTDDTPLEVDHDQGDDSPSTPSDEPASDEATTGDAANREAAKYRRRLRDTEAERDTLAARVETMQRADAERVAAAVLADGADLWLAADLADLLDDDGQVDPDAVRTAAEQVTGTRPGLAAPVPDLGQGARGQGPTSQVSWTSALRGH